MMSAHLLCAMMLPTSSWTSGAGGALLRYRKRSCAAVAATATAIPTASVAKTVTNTVLRVARWMPAEMRRLRGPGRRDCRRLRVACGCGLVDMERAGGGGAVVDERSRHQGTIDTSDMTE